MTMWDEEYAVDEYVYGTAPNDLLAALTARLTPGRVLCLAVGEGRNAVHLARAGFQVTGVDSSSVGLAKAQDLARESGVEIETIRADLADYEIVAGCWDSIVSVFCHLPPALRAKVHRSVVAGLEPGGTLLLEAYTPRQLEFGTGGPPVAEMMTDLTTLREELAGLEFLHARELVRDVVEGVNHAGRGAVVQILARKP